MRKNIFVILFFSSVIGFSQDISNVSVSIEKLKINTSLSEISSDYVDGKLVYFQNKNSLKRYSEFYDLFILVSNFLSRKNGEKNKISLTDQLTIVTNYHEGPCFVDHINGKIYITISSLDKKGMKRAKKLNNLKANRLRIIEGDYKNGIISNLKEFTYNNPEYNIAHATYSHTTKRLYFASTMPNGKGGSDIFYCTKQLDGTWSEPKNVGERINSLGDEYFPYVKNGILFFASNNQRKQVGSDLDIYYINEQNLLTDFPKSLEGINSDKDDFAICFSKVDTVMEGFFTSNRENAFGSNDDIYSFKFSNVIYDNSYNLFIQFTNKDSLIKNGLATLVDEEGNEILKSSISKDNIFIFNEINKAKQYKIIFDNEIFTRIFNLPVNYDDSEVHETINIEFDEPSDTLLTSNSIESNKGPKTEEILKFKADTAEVTLVPKSLKDSSSIAKDTVSKNIVVSKMNDEIAIGDSETIEFSEREKFENIYFAFDSYEIYEYSQKKT